MRTLCYQIGNILLYLQQEMRIIATRTLKDYSEKFPAANSNAKGY
jgi:hypothetical protein